MKKYLVSVCSILLILSLFISCGANEKKNFITDTNAGYEIEESDGKFYLVITDDAYKSKANASQVVPSLTFQTVAEMKDKVLNGKLTEEEKRTMSTFAKDESKKIQVLDFDKLGEIVLPNSMKIESVIWSGSSYAMFISDKAAEASMEGEVFVHTEQKYQERLEKNHESLSAHDDVQIRKTEGATEYVFSTKTVKLKVVSYALEVDSTELIVDECYVLDILDSNIEDLVTVNEDVPSTVDIWGRNSEFFFEVYLHGIAESPSLEWYSAFNIVAVD